MIICNSFKIVRCHKCKKQSTCVITNLCCLIVKRVFVYVPPSLKGQFDRNHVALNVQERYTMQDIMANRETRVSNLSSIFFITKSTDYKIDQKMVDKVNTIHRTKLIIFDLTSVDLTMSTLLLSTLLLSTLQCWPYVVVLTKSTIRC